MSEATIISGLKTVIQSVTGFTSTSVTTEDWSILDGPFAASPFFVFEMSDEFISRQDAPSEQNTWNITGTLYVAFDNWATTRANLRTYRQAIIDKFNEVGTARSAGGLAATDVREIRNGSGVIEVYNAYTPADLTPESLPILLSQDIIFVVEEYSNG